MTTLEDKEFLLSVISEAVKKGARKHAVCSYFDIPLRTIQRWEKEIVDKRTLQKRNSKNSLSESEKEEIIQICSEKRFVDLSPHEIVPILAEEGKYVASESTFYRILRQQEMLKHRRRSRAPRERAKIEHLVATGPNQVWSWDITYLKTDVKRMFFYLYLFMDVWSRKIVAWDIHTEQTAENASTILQESGYSKLPKGIRLRSDNGSPMKGATFLGTLHQLGIVPSYSRPSVSNDNAYSESLFKTLKYSEPFPEYFKSTEQAVKWTESFVDWYNTQHRHSGIGFVTPEQRHCGQDKKILKTRRETYQKAREKHPERFFQGKTKKWDWRDTVELNPESSELKKVS